MTDRSCHKGDITGLFCVNNDSILLSTSMDGAMHVYKLGSMSSSDKIDNSLSLVSMVFYNHIQASLDELLKGFETTDTSLLLDSLRILFSLSSSVTPSTQVFAMPR